MFTSKELNFVHKSILTGTMLREIYKYPREFFRLLYQNFSDGIICGLDYFIDGGNLFLSAGVIRFDGDFYFLEKDLNISALAAKNNLASDNTYYICVEKNSRQEEPCLTEKNLAIIFTKENKLPVLGKFFFMGADNFNLPTLAFGKNIKNPFEDIFKRAVLNLADVQFAAVGGATFHPLLFGLVKDFLDGKEYKTPFDFAVLAQIQSGGVISLPTIKSYIATVDKDFNFDSCTRADLFQTFCDDLVSSKFNPSYASPDENIDVKPSPKSSRSHGKLL